MKNIAIIMLAAGASARMGKPKQLMNWGEKLLINHCLEQACLSNASSVFLVLGAYADKIIPHISFCGSILMNQKWQQGMAYSIRTGVEQAVLNKSDAVLMLVADQPFVHRDYLNKMMDAYQADKHLIIATQYDQNMGVPALFDKQLFPKLLALEGDKGAQAVISQNKITCFTITPNFPLIDLDFPTDFKTFY